MRWYFAISSLFCCSLFGQQPAPPVPAMTDQQIVEVLNAIEQHESRLEPMLAQLHPNDWVAKGAADTYVAQFASVNQQIRLIETDMSGLAQRPNQMTECMKALFRAQAFHQTLDSLLGGLRRYQNPALADLIEAVAAEDRSDLDRLQRWVLELAAAKDAQFDLVDREAQRCRATLSRQPAGRSK